VSLKETTSAPSSTAPAAAPAPPIQIPFNKPFLTGYEFVYISEAIRFGHTAGDGPFTRKAQALIEQILGVPKALLTTSCTDALEMAAILLDVKEGDEIIVPSFTFVSTVNAFVLRGARPVFIDIRRDTLNMDESLLESLVTPRTKAVLPVHYAGVGCDMDVICAVARKHGIAVIEDNAHGLLGRYHGRNLGTFGELATQSFHETKNITCGEGGALVINDPLLVERAEIIREKGTNRARFYRGQVDKYTWVDIGSSYLPSDIVAAYLLAQLEAREMIQRSRQRIWNFYNDHLAQWAAANRVRLPIVPDGCEQPYHMFYMLMPTFAARQALLAHLRRRGILAVFHYVPLHNSEMGQRLGGGNAHCPATEDISDRLVRLPFYNSLTEDEQATVVAAILELSTA
jgi:dTDP-4-amino-4,6-dideoxygalactose transaminase